MARKNTLPYFATDLETSLYFRGEAAFVYKLPEIIDDDGDEVTVRIRNDDFPWLTYNAASSSIEVAKDATSDSEVGTYLVNLYLNDGYEFGSNEVFFRIELEVDIPDRPFYTFIPSNKAPNFLEELTSEEQ